jgi:hypothetical protein
MSKRSKAAGYVQRLKGELRAMTSTRNKEVNDLNRRLKVTRAKWDGKLKELRKRMEYWSQRNRASTGRRR